MLFRNANPEERLVLRLQKREEQAFNELVLGYEKSVYRLAFRMLGNVSDAEDLAQEVFVQVFKSIETFRGDSKISTWLYRITVNLSHNRNKYHARRHSQKHQDLDETSPNAADTASGWTVGQVSRPDQEMLGTELERIVEACLRELEPEFREVLILRDVEGLSYEEVALLLELPQGTLKSRLHRARAELKRLVEARLGEPLG
jgi:RNA polymerase sigma-70 factor, ECF subfamily